MSPHKVQLTETNLLHVLFFLSLNSHNSTNINANSTMFFPQVLLYNIPNHPNQNTLNPIWHIIATIAK